MKSITAVLDTNTFIHYNRLDTIEWFNFIEADVLRLVVTSTVMRELNKLKVTSPIAQVRKTADSSLRFLAEIAADPAHAQVRPKVQLEFKVYGPLLDFPAHQLNPDIIDDEILAHVIEIRNSRSNADVVVVTADLVLTLIAQVHGFRAISIPAAFQRQEGQTPEEKRIKELEAQLRELKTVLPDLLLCFEDGSKSIALSYYPFYKSTDAQIARKLEKIKKEWPERPLPSAPKPGIRSPINLTIRGETVIKQPSCEAVVIYNSDISSFHRDYEEFLRKSEEHQEFNSRSFELTFHLHNRGGTPAREVEVSILLPKMVEVVADQPPTQPRQPSPPTWPLSERSNSIFRNPMQDYLAGATSMLHHQRAEQLVQKLGRNISDAQIFPLEDGVKVKYHIRKIRHHGLTLMLPLRIVFPSQVSSFRIDYSIAADNVPNKVRDTLNVQIKKSVETNTVQM